MEITRRWKKLMPVVYDELRRLARNCLRRERPEHTLQATALVNEAYLKLVEQRNTLWPRPPTVFWHSCPTDASDSGGSCPSTPGGKARWP